jgi:hypothetical protein
MMVEIFEDLILTLKYIVKDIVFAEDRKIYA